MSFINNPDITKEEVLKESLAHWNVENTGMDRPRYGYCNGKKRRLLFLGS